jgi:ribosome maturation factor RimP
VDPPGPLRTDFEHRADIEHRDVSIDQDAVTTEPTKVDLTNTGSEAGQPASRFSRETGLAASLADLIEPSLIDLGFRLVRITISGREGKTVQIMAERPDGSIAIEDCEQISHQVSALLDVNELITGAYRLEISSPGIDRPLVRLSDFEDWAGHEAKIELSEPVGGRKRFRGKLEGFEGNEVRIECDLDQIGLTTLGFPVGLISDAHLVLTDDLIREALRRSKDASKSGLGDGAEPTDDIQIKTKTPKTKGRKS